ncbi:MAG: uroporphyrinogen decarboxylase family protein [Candidatus Latescibacterota bacterium]|jgi:uroporphyrinogen decarboxylase
MSASVDRVHCALAHQRPDRTPLFEIFSPYHPIHWEICGRNPATDNGLAWDALAEGIGYDELLHLNIKAQYEICRYYHVDMVRLNGGPAWYNPPPVKTGPNTWTLNGVRYWRNPKTDLVVLEDPAAEAGYSHRYDEDQLRRQIEEWDGAAPTETGHDPVLAGVQRLAKTDGVEWAYMGEIGAGTGVAFYPPFMLMWMLDEPDLLRRWIEMQKVRAFAATRQQIADGCTVIAMGGDVSCDKGPFISPALYREFILPVIQEHVDLIHSLGARAVYTSDGNHWPIKEEFFFASRIDGYKEVDQAAGMTWPRLISEGVADRICIIGNLDARHNLCHGSPAEVRAEVIRCLDYGRSTAGGHVIHASHSVHEDMPWTNYHAAAAAYREYFGLAPLPR